jgi:hypothetical protein
MEFCFSYLSPIQIRVVSVLQSASAKMLFLEPIGAVFEKSRRLELFAARRPHGRLPHGHARDLPTTGWQERLA